MAIAFDAYSTGSTTGTSLTVSHTTSGSNRILIVGVQTGTGGSSLVTGITYNGTAMTNIDSSIGNGVQRWLETWYLIAPTSGTHDIVVSTSGSVFIQVVATSYTGALQSGQPDAHGTKASVSGSSFSHAITTVHGECWLVGFLENDGGTIVAGASTTLRSALGGLALADSNGTVAVGSVSLAYTGANADWNSLELSIQPTEISISVSDTVTMTETTNVFFKFVFTILDSITMSDTATAIKNVWNNITKNTVSITNETKHTVTATNETKHSSTFTNETKS